MYSEMFTGNFCDFFLLLYYLVYSNNSGCDMIGVVCVCVCVWGGGACLCGL